MDIIQWINSVNGIENAVRILQDDFGVKVKQDGSFYLFDYSQIDSPKHHDIVEQCRGIIIDSTDLSVACRPFRRFYNFGEHPVLEKNFNWNGAVAFEKADGSLIKVWFNHHAGRWEIGTRGSMFGDNCITTLSGEDGTISFRELFLRAAGMDESAFQGYMTFHCNEYCTFLFELCTLENKVVTQYEKDTLVYLGHVYNKDGMEFKPHSSFSFVKRVFRTARLPSTTPIKSFEQVLNMAESLTGLQEGFVIMDGNGQRLKVKSRAYVTAHHLRGEGVTPKRAVLLALAGEVDEFLSYFDEFRPLLMPYQDRVYDIRRQISNVYDRIHTIESQKEFALEATKYPFSGVLFELRKGKRYEDIERAMTDNAKLALFGVKNV